MKIWMLEMKFPDQKEYTPIRFYTTRLGARFSKREHENDYNIDNSCNVSFRIRKYGPMGLDKQ